MLAMTRVATNVDATVQVRKTTILDDLRPVDREESYLGETIRYSISAYEDSQTQMIDR